MPSTVGNTFRAVGLKPTGPVGWGQTVPETTTGVYVVALTADADDATSTLSAAPLNRKALSELLIARADLRLDGDPAKPTPAALAARLDAFWLPDEVVLYIGLAGQPLRKRVRQYYRTPLGARRPHAGGWWLKTLSVLEQLHVYWARTPAYAIAEKEMLRVFADGVAAGTRNALHDTERVMPFANLRGHDDLVKRHGIRGATGDLAKGRGTGG